MGQPSDLVKDEDRRITMTLSPAKLYLVSSPEMPSGIVQFASASRMRAMVCLPVCPEFLSGTLPDLHTFVLIACGPA